MSALTATIAPAAAPRRTPPLHEANALVIGAHAGTRSINCTQLRDLGLSRITQCARLQQARRAIERERFDVILFNDDFDGPPSAGWDLFDELRREQVLPHSTVLMALASQASYAKVREAAEAVLDGYLLKPYTAVTLGERLKAARRRKAELADMLEAMSAGRWETAARLGLARFRERRPYAQFGARLGAELLLQLGQPQAAVEVYQAVVEQFDPAETAWARLGMVRAWMQRGESAKARKGAIDLLTAHPSYADGHEMLGQLCVDQGDIRAALDAYRQASQLTPGCILRLQTCGALAFYAGEADEAAACLERASQLGLRSRLFDGLTLALQAVLRFDAGDVKGLAAMHQQMRAMAAEFDASRRLQRFVLAGEALALLHAQTADAAAVPARALAAQSGDDDFDSEAAVLTLLVWARVGGRDQSAGEIESLLKPLALRHCVSKAATEVLLAAAAANELLVNIVRQAQAQVAAVAEQCLSLTLAGRVRESAQALLDHGRQWRNAKLLEMAAMVVRRHEAAIDDAAELAAAAAAELERLPAATAHIAGLRRTGRSPGGLILRR